ncbi:MAG: polyhydroxyalkanoate synthesis repressor PhaR [Pseudomonadota bacterium]|nr:polyhydroxyalkanoate synthesis repressor PhaR [Pseudomonadota bacterium]
MQTKEPKPVVIKKYANRRLYDTETSAYITLEDLCERVKAGRQFVVLDAKTGQDLTRQVLTQIIFEQETKGFQMLPTGFLRSVIRFYDDKMHDVLQHYLEASMNTFLNNQERMQSMMGKAVEDLSPLNPFEEITRQNVAFFEKTMQMFNPFGQMFSGREEEAQEEVKEERKARAKR